MRRCFLSTCCLLIIGIVGCVPQRGQVIEEFGGRVYAVGGGDTLFVERTAGQHAEYETVRLFGVDASEISQPDYFTGMRALENLVVGKDVHVTIVSNLSHPLKNAWVWVGTGQKDERDSVNWQMVANGWAWHDIFQTIPKGEDDSLKKVHEILRDAEDGARKARHGIWKGESEPRPPWAEKRAIPDDVITASVAAHMNAIENISYWVFFASVIAVWSALRKHEQLELVGLQIPARDAAFVLTVLYVFANAYTIVLVWRVGDLVAAQTSLGVNRALWTIGVHPWILNPFAVGKSSFITRSGPSLLILLWWLATTAVALVERAAHPERVRLGKLVRWLFPSFACLQLLAFTRVLWIFTVHGEYISVSVMQGISWPTAWIWSTGLAMTATIGGFLVFRRMLVQRVPKPAK